ncbi:MAG: phosphatase PAP2 family protein [Fimbriimonas sp.]
MDSVFRLDLEVFRTIHLGWHGPILDPFFWVFSSLGLGYVQLLLSALVLCFPRYRRLFWPLVLAIAISGLPLAQVFKQFIYRERPSHLVWAHPQEGFKYDSFPSGHTSTSFAVAFLLCFLLPRRFAWVKVLALVLATCVGISRIYRGVHWPSDVVAGVFCGLCGAALVRLLVSPINDQELRS